MLPWRTRPISCWLTLFSKPRKGRKSLKGKKRRQDILDACPFLFNLYIPHVVTIKGMTKHPNQGWAWLLGLSSKQGSEPVEETRRNGHAGTRTWIQENLVSPFLASVMEIQATATLVPAATGIGCEQIPRHLTCYFFNECLCQPSSFPASSATWNR